jgi:hypothetical protein
MKKKTRRQLKKGVKQLKQLLGPAQDAPGTALGAFALGGLLATLAKDEEIRGQMRELARVTLRRIGQLVSGGVGEHGAEEPHHEGGLKHAH